MRHHTETLFMFTIFVSMFRSMSISVVFMQCVFHFRLQLHYDQLYNLMNTDTLVLLLIFSNLSYWFWIITLMKNVNNFQIAKVQPQGVA